MKLKICALLLFAVACLVMEGCSAYDYTEHESTLDSAKVYSACWPAADSALLDFLADTAYSGMVVYGNYMARSKEMKRDTSKNSTIYRFSVAGDVKPEKDVFSIKLVLEYKVVDDAYGTQEYGDSLFVDIYGCRDYGCKLAEKVVLRNGDYSFTKLLKKGEFEISSPKGDFFSVEAGYDCDVVKEYFFHLNIDLDDVKIDLDAQKGSETCSYRSSKWCLYC